MEKYYTIEQIKKRYFPTVKSYDESCADHLLYLADVEKTRQNDNTYTLASDTFKANSVKRIQHYIEVCTPKEKAMPEYQIFKAAMEKSIVMCTE